jgi:uncharacterized protein (UPF0264 family)
MSRTRPGLLVSVRSVAEARSALEGGADLIDIKEPARGSLGRANDDTIAAIVRFVDGRRPVSAAAGELMEAGIMPSSDGLAFVKWGLAGCGGRCYWRRQLAAKLSAQGAVRSVIVAYADWQEAAAPPVDEVVEFARAQGATLLLDTFTKDSRSDASRRSLLNWLSVAKVIEVCRCLHEAGLRIALAGSLDSDGITALHDAQPDWFAVRSAVCIGGRDGTVAASRVRELVSLLATPGTLAALQDR